MKKLGIKKEATALGCLWMFMVMFMVALKFAFWAGLIFLAIWGIGKLIGG